jgi:hypothetical protein
MKLDLSTSNFAMQASWQLDLSSKSCLKQSLQDFQTDIWVKLLELPHLYSFDEALLLCQVSDDEWLAWIPDYGEAQLHISQFSQISD